jgi:c-di-GMP-related signal transduction protein
MGDFGSIRRALMMVGVTPLKHWLTEQLPRAVDDPDLRPLQEMSVLTAQLMQAMVDAGSEQQLLRELYLCGLFSDLDLLCGETLTEVLQDLPLPDRVRDAIVLQRGAYAHYLRIVQAQFGRNASDVARVCAEADVSLEEANRTLLRILGRLRPEQPLALRAVAVQP